MSFKIQLIFHVINPSENSSHLTICSKFDNLTIYIHNSSAAFLSELHLFSADMSKIILIKPCVTPTKVQVIWSFLANIARVYLQQVPPSMTFPLLPEVGHGSKLKGLEL